MFPNDILAFVFSFVYVGGIIYACKYLRDRGYDLHKLRETTHMLMGVWPLVWLLFETMFAAFMVTVIITLFLIFAPKSIRRVYSGGEEKHYGLIIYSATFMCITCLYWMSPIGAAAIFTLAFSDGMAGYVGKHYGGHKFRVPWGKTKSIEGSLAFFLMSIISIILAYSVFATLPCLTLVIIYALILTITEAISPPHSDNFTIPITSILLLEYLPYLLCP